MSDADAISEGYEVVVRKDASINIFTVKAKKQFWLDKLKFSFDGAIGHPYGSSFNLVDHNLVKVTIDKTDGDEEAACGSSDNRNLQDEGSVNQKLSADDIEAMRKEGVSGKIEGKETGLMKGTGTGTDQDIVERLVENSETFDTKTEFSKEKYLRKKKKKHVPVLTILKPNYRLMFEYHNRRARSKLAWIREDGIAQLLCQGNVRAGGRYLVVDGIDGLITGAVLNRLGAQDTESDGCIVEFYSGQQPAKMMGMWTKQFYLNHVFSVPNGRVEALRYAVLGAGAQRSTTKRRDPPRMPVEDGQPEPGPDQSVTESVLAQPAVRYTDFSHAAPDSDTRFRCTPCDPGCYSKRHRTEHGQNGVSHGQGEAVSTTSGDCPTCTTEAGEVKRKDPPEATDNSFRQRRFDAAVKVLGSQKMDGLFIASKAYPLPILMDLTDFMAPSRQVVVYCPYQEALMMCYKAMKDSGRFVNMTLSETWLRDYQVLSNRTHPTINMNGGGGYLLTATTIHKE